MKVYARARKQDGELVRVTLSDDRRSRTLRAQAAAGQEQPGGAGDALLPGWWDRWWLWRALQQTGYQRLF